MLLVLREFHGPQAHMEDLYSEIAQGGVLAIIASDLLDHGTIYLDLVSALSQSDEVLFPTDRISHPSEVCTRLCMESLDDSVISTTGLNELLGSGKNIYTGL